VDVPWHTKRRSYGRARPILHRKPSTSCHPIHPAIAQPKGPDETTEEEEKKRTVRRLPRLGTLSRCSSDVVRQPEPGLRVLTTTVRLFPPPTLPCKTHHGMPQRVEGASRAPAEQPSSSQQPAAAAPASAVGRVARAVGRTLIGLHEHHVSAPGLMRLPGGGPSSMGFLLMQCIWSRPVGW
jgi:hypothetical protein